MANAKKLKSGSWRVQVFSHYELVDGKKKARYRSFTAPTKAEAELIAAKFASEKSAVSSGHVTIRQAVKRYIDLKEKVLSPSTIRAYDSIYRNQIAEIAELDVARISSDDLQEWVGHMTLRVSPKTVKNAYGLVISAIGLFSSRTYRVSLPARSPIVRHIPTDEDVAALMEGADRPLRMCIALAAIGTLRRGEICGLVYGDVRENAVFVHTDMVLNVRGEWVHKQMPKTSASVRLVPLPAAVIDLIGTGEPDAFVYDGTPTTLTDGFIRLRDKLGMKCRFHDLRHYAASIMHAIGIPDVYIMERGGWSTDGTLKSIYRNSLDDMSQKFSAQANEHFKKLLPE